MISLFDIGRVFLGSKKELITQITADTKRDYPYDCLEDVVIGEKQARATTRLALTAVGGPLMVHSTFALTPMMRIAEYLAQDRVTLVEKCRFLQPMQSELDLTAKIINNEDAQNHYPGATTVMTCKTTKGNHIEVVGTAKDKPIYGGNWTSYNDRLSAAVKRKAESGASSSTKRKLIRLAHLDLGHETTEEIDLSGFTGTANTELFSTYADLAMNTTRKMSNTLFAMLVSSIEGLSVPSIHDLSANHCRVSVAKIDRSKPDSEGVTMAFTIGNDTKEIASGRIKIVTITTISRETALEAALYRAKWTK